MHQQLYGITGYDNPDHWCSLGRKHFSARAVPPPAVKKLDPVTPEPKKPEPKKPEPKKPEPKKPEPKKPEPKKPEPKKPEPKKPEPKKPEPKKFDLKKPEPKSQIGFQRIALLARIQQQEQARAEYRHCPWSR